MAFFAGIYTIKVIHYILQPGPGGELWAIDSSAPQAPIDVSGQTPVVESQNQFQAYTPSNAYTSLDAAVNAAVALLAKTKATGVEVIDIDLTGG